jgi:hypothetical protein
MGRYCADRWTGACYTKMLAFEWGNDWRCGWTEEEIVMEPFAILCIDLDIDTVADAGLLATGQCWRPRSGCREGSSEAHMGWLIY